MLDDNDLLTLEQLQEWAVKTKEKLLRKMPIAVQKAQAVDFIPYSTKDGEWTPTKIDWWTNGFWGATMWQMYRMSGDEMYRKEAIRAEEMMDEALRHPLTLHHDVGFMWLIQSGVRYAMERNEQSRDRCLFCADMLAGRFNPTGFIRAWNDNWHGRINIGWGIIDTMMNLNLLFWASRATGDPRFAIIARRHADTAARYFVRPDGSCNHIVEFDPYTGELMDTPAGQGCERGSSWSRGQAWALYGFTLAYKNTGKRYYLQKAEEVADYFRSQLYTTGYVPRCDFCQPKEVELYDNAAGVIAACGMIELAKILVGRDDFFYHYAGSMLMAMDEKCSDWTDKTPAILQKCTGSYKEEESHHITMNYADYFLIEAVNKLLGDKMLFWMPDVKQ